MGIQITQEEVEERILPFTESSNRDLLSQYNENVEVGLNPHATIVAVNPGLARENFGAFTVPSLSDLTNNGGPCSSGALAAWGILQGQELQKRKAVVPPETGRAVLFPNWNHHLYHELLIKGTGPVERFIYNNKLRDSSRSFDGFLEISEAERDLVYSEILHLAGVRVAAGIGVVNHQRIQVHPTFTAWIGNYVRGFRSQIRISNLFEMAPLARKKYIDIAMERMGQTREEVPSNYVDYFNTMVELCARNVALLQAIGFTQDSLHYGQITLCGEQVDFGIGSFKRPAYVGQVNTLHPWFRFERQPILVQNILYKTHAVKAEPFPAVLARDSRAVREQRTLFGAIRSFCKRSADQIEASNPVERFWQVYNDTYGRFDLLRFKQEVLDRFESYFNWEPENMLAQIPEERRLAVAGCYSELLSKLNDHYENQIATWDRYGATAIHRQILFGQAARQTIPPGITLDFSNEEVGVWRSQAHRNYISQNLKSNPIRDLSWKPNIVAC